MNQREKVYVGNRLADVGQLKSAFEIIGLQAVQFRPHSDRSNEHGSAYATGQYHDQTGEVIAEVGVLYGRPVKYYQHEADGLRMLSHKGIPRCYGVGELETPAGNFGYLLVSHFTAPPIKDITDLSSSQGKMKLREHLSVLVDLIDYIHSQGVVHQDIDLEHVLTGPDGEVYLIDFHTWDGFWWESPAADFCGTSQMPSMIEQEEYDRPFYRNMAGSWWEPRGFGVLLKQLLSFNAGKDSFVKQLKGISRYLTDQPRAFVQDDKSRDLISNEVREKIKCLSI